jgi:hypothetical protein
MKNLRIMMAAASMMILLFCGSEAVAQSSYSAAKSLDIKQMVDLGSVDLVSDADALEIISLEYKSFAAEEPVSTEEVEHSIKAAFYSHMASELVSSKSIEIVLTEGRSELVKIANRFITPGNLSLEGIYNDAVALVEDN